jgi:asparagine synthase (glutamine-hydrolysing)
MCGICGIIDLTDAQRSLGDTVRAMSGRIRHRGPDGDGFHDAPGLSFGMRRLSIIDVAGSDQPLFNEDHSISLVFNGEIYNYRELRRQLAESGHHLRTEGDGETIAHLYEAHGIGLFGHLRGMYAFALHDASAQQTLLSVDHIGMKPLYLWEHDGLLSFASEVKAFLADPDFRPALNPEALDAYLSFGYMIGEQTLFAGVRRLMPGHCALIEDGSVSIREHWRFGARQDTAANRSQEDVIAQTRELLHESIRLHLRSDVPLGLFLSGGVDSAAVLALMSREAGPQVGERVRTFTVGYDSDTPDNELAAARRIAAHFGADHHERVIRAGDWWNALEGYVYHHDEPNANPSAITLMLLAEHTAREVRVVLTGLGGDELFAGYGNHRLLPRLLTLPEAAHGWRPLLARAIAGIEPLYPRLKQLRGFGALPTLLPRLHHRLLPRDEALLRSQSFDGLVFSETLRRRLYGPKLREATASGYRQHAFAEIVRHSQRPDPDDMAQAIVINTWLPGNALLNCDKVTMAHSLEARVPFFDPVLLDFAANVPPAMRMQSNKFVLREAAREWLPAFALERPKQPFSTPILGWFQRELRDRIQSVLTDRGSFVRSLFETAALDTLLGDHFSGRASHVEVVFRLLTLEMWAKVFLY